MKKKNGKIVVLALFAFVLVMSFIAAKAQDWLNENRKAREANKPTPEATESP